MLRTYRHSRWTSQRVRYPEEETTTPTVTQARYYSESTARQRQVVYSILSQERGHAGHVKTYEQNKKAQQGRIRGAATERAGARSILILLILILVSSEVVRKSSGADASWQLGIGARYMSEDAPEGVGDVELDIQEDVGKSLQLLRVLDLRPGFIGSSSSEGGASSRRLIPVGDAIKDTLGGLTDGDGLADKIVNREVLVLVDG